PICMFKLADSSFLPLLVVMMMTPFEAREPYMAVAEASLRMENDSMSLGFMVLRMDLEPPTVTLSMGRPSITIKGSVEAPNEAPPRIRMTEPEPGSPPVFMETPA